MTKDFRYALRGLLRSPGFAVVAILALALGIGSTTAIFTVVDSVLLRPLPFRDPGRLYRVAAYSSNAPQQLYSLTDPDYIALAQQSSAFESTAALFGYSRRNLTGAGEPVSLHTPDVTPSFWTVLGVNPVLGRTFREDDGHVAVLSASLWRSRFHVDPSILGKPVLLDDVPYTIVGVMPQGFAYPDQDDDAWLPAKLDPLNDHLAMRTVIGKLKPGVTPQRAQAEIDGIAARLAAARKLPPGGWRVLSLQESMVGKIRPALAVLLGAVSLLLLIACVNVANLLLARGARRDRELAVRRSLGATQMRLVLQLLIESLVLSGIGGIAGVLVAAWAVPALLSLTPAGLLPRFEEIHIEWRVLAFAFLLSAVCSVLFGLWPALQAAKNTAGKLRSTTSSRAHQGGNILVISEIAVALMLLAGGGLVFRSFLKLRAVDPGFRSEQLVTVSVNLSETYKQTGQMNRFHQSVLERLASLPGVRSAAAVNWLPMGTDLIRGSFRAADRPAASHFMVTKPGVSPGYFETMGTRLLKGRDFTSRDSQNASGVAIIGEVTARRVWGSEDPVGKRITLEDDPEPGDWLTVVGVVDDVKQDDLGQAAPPAIYQPLAQVKRPLFLSSMSYVIRTGLPVHAIESGIRKRLDEIDRNQPIARIATMNDLLAANTAAPRFYSRVLISFSLLGLLLATLGTYGVISYGVAHRTREIGIRVALGAQRSEVLGSVMGGSAILVACGVLIGIAGAFAVTRVLRSFLFEVTPTDPATFAGASLLLAAVALAASYIPARRAMRVDPVVALRDE